jgi:hypothetical protein
MYVFDYDAPTIDLHAYKLSSTELHMIHIHALKVILHLSCKPINAYIKYATSYMNIKVRCF